MDILSNPLVIGIIAGVLTGISLLPQLFKTVKEKKAPDISYAMLAFLMAGLCLWVYYGFLKKDLPVIITNAFSVCVNAAILVLSFIYPNKKKT